MITDYYELFERFSIMTVDGKLTDREALSYLHSRTSPGLFQKLLMTINKK